MDLGVLVNMNGEQLRQDQAGDEDSPDGEHSYVPVEHNVRSYPDARTGKEEQCRHQGYYPHARLPDDTLMILHHPDITCLAPASNTIRSCQSGTIKTRAGGCAGSVRCGHSFVLKRWSLQTCMR